jgi:activator of 2-hydroxyglutaryl-CoA dehydratase
MEPEITVIGGVMRFETMGQVVRQHLKTTVNVPETHLVQFIPALGGALLGQQRLHKMHQEAAAPAHPDQAAAV